MTNSATLRHVRLGARLVELDAILGLAALGAVNYHFTSNYDRLWGHESGFRLSFPWGAYGVQVFFVLSGFVILMTLERVGSLREFAVHRAIRLYPVYWFAIAATFTVVMVFGLPGKEVSRLDAVANVTMAQAAFGFRDVDGPYWTLHVELCFYILMSMLFGLGLARWLVPIAGALCVAGLLNTQLGGRHDWPGFWRLERAWPLRHFLPYFFFGMLLHRARTMGFRNYSIPLGLSFGLMVVQSDWSQAIVATLVILPVTQISLPFLRLRPLVYLGFISYSLYLVHANIGYVIIRECDERQLSGYVGVAIALILTLATASLSALLIEGVVCNWLRQLWRKRFSQFEPPEPIHSGLRTTGQSG